MAATDSIIQDALEGTRNLHRLILTASVVTVVFALSLRSPNAVVVQHKSLDAFLQFDFIAYEGFLAQRVESVARPWLATGTSELDAAIKAVDFKGFGAEQITNALGKPLLLGQFKVGETKLRVPGEFTLKDLATLWEVYPLGGDVLVAVPNSATFLDQVVQHLTQNARLGTSVQNVRLDTSETFSDSAPPAEGGTIKLILSFETIPPGGGAAPVFDGHFDAVVRRVPRTAFLEWLSAQSAAGTFAQVGDRAITWLPELKGLPRRQAEKKLSEIFAALGDELQQGSPEKKSVSLLGSEIPGVLLVYAAPLLLMALSYHFIFHLEHLRRFASENRLVYNRFAWPLFSTDRSWQREVPMTLVVLPASSMAVLAFQLYRFRFLDAVAGGFLIVAILVLIGCGCSSMRRLDLLKREINEALPADFEI